mgnify:FL=1
MRNISRTQIGNALTVINYEPTKTSRINNQWLLEKSWVTDMLDTAVQLNKYAKTDMVWQMIQHNGLEAYDNYCVMAFRTKGDIVGFVIFRKQNLSTLKKLHILIYPKNRKVNYSVLYGIAPFSSWEGYILENVKENHYLRFLDYFTSDIEVAISKLQCEE